MEYRQPQMRLITLKFTVSFILWNEKHLWWKLKVWWWAIFAFVCYSRSFGISTESIFICNGRWFGIIGMWGKFRSCLCLRNFIGCFVLFSSPRKSPFIVHLIGEAEVLLKRSLDFSISFKKAFELLLKTIYLHFYFFFSNNQSLIVVNNSQNSQNELWWLFTNSFENFRLWWKWLYSFQMKF